MTQQLPDRRSRQPENRRTRQLAFRVTESDYNRIISRGDRSGLPINEYLRRTALNGQTGTTL